MNDGVRDMDSDDIHQSSILAREVRAGRRSPMGVEDGFLIRNSAKKILCNERVVEFDEMPRKRLL